MDDILLSLGSIVEVEHDEELKKYIIIGKRVINHETMNAWDYISVPYNEGFKRRIIFKPETSKIDEKGIILRSQKIEREENYFYFNHCDIDKIVYKFNLITDKTESN